MKKYLAFDVGGTSVKYAVVNEEGEVSSSNKFKTPDTLEKMYQEIENVAHEYQDIEGIALSMPGAVDSDDGIIYGSVLRLNLMFEMVTSFIAMVNIFLYSTISFTFR